MDQHGNPRIIFVDLRALGLRVELWIVTVLADARKSTLPVLAVRIGNTGVQRSISAFVNINTLSTVTTESTTTIGKDTSTVTTSIETIGSGDHTWDTVADKSRIGIETNCILGWTSIYTQDNTFINVNTWSITSSGDLTFFTFNQSCELGQKPNVVSGYC